MYEHKTKPYEHQCKVFETSRDKKYFALLMDMGTGKSKVIVDNAAWLYEEKKIDALLVIAPNGVHLNWVRNEIPAHLPDRIPRFVVPWESGNQSKKYAKSMVKLFDATQELKIFTMNIEALSSKRGAETAQRFLKRYPLSMTVIDESSKIKTPRAKRTKIAVNLRKLTAYRRILTGTPITQSPLDLFPQLYFLSPDILMFTSFYAFKHHYAKVIQKIAVDGSGRQYKYEDVVGYQNLDELQRRLASCSYRITKQECLDLPDKIYTQIIVDLSPEQKKLYKKLTEDLLLEVAGAELPIPMVLTRLLRLQQITGGFVAPEDAAPVPIHEDGGPKLRALLSDVEDLPAAESAIIWARFVPEIEAILAALRKAYGFHTAGAYYGATKRGERADLIDSFQSGKTRFFVGNPQAAGMGLTLHRASTVYYYSNDFSLENRLQSEDRAHRIGQQKNVLYKDIVCNKTIDEKVLKVLREKKSVADLVVSGNVRSFLGL